MAEEVAVIALLPKPDGGRRPIGLFPAVIRVWMRARSAILRDWERKNDHPSLCGSAGKAATRATWLSAWEAESARAREGLYAQALLDLAKAFETVPHAELWRQAEERGYPLRILRLALAAYRAPRVIGADGVYSRLVRASRGITAGSGTATAELRVLVLGLLDILRIQCPNITAAVYVDDVNLEASDRPEAAEPTCHAPRPQQQRRQQQQCRSSQRHPTQTAAEKKLLTAARLATEVAEAVNVTVRYFEVQLGMEVSAPKSKIASSMPSIATLAQSLVKKRKATALNTRKGETAKMLGVATNGGATRVVKTLRKQAQNVKDRIWRYRMLGQKGFCKRSLARATIMPAAGYGLETQGISDSALQALRRTALLAVGTDTQGGNLDAEWLACGGAREMLDPAFYAHTAPIMFMATAWWEGWRSADQLRASFRMAVEKLDSPRMCRQSTWSRVNGPATADFMTAARLGWHFTAANEIITDDGRSLQLRKTHPRPSAELWSSLSAAGASPTAWRTSI